MKDLAEAITSLAAWNIHEIGKAGFDRIVELTGFFLKDDDEAGKDTA